MSGPRIRVYTDEDVDPAAAEQLGRQGYDALSCLEAGNHNQGLPDEWQLQFATDNGRAIVSYNVSHYATLDGLWKTSGREHYGMILLSRRMSIGELGRQLRQHLTNVSRDQQFNT